MEVEFEQFFLTATVLYKTVYKRCKLRNLHIIRNVNINTYTDYTKYFYAETIILLGRF